MQPRLRPVILWLDPCRPGGTTMSRSVATTVFGLALASLALTASAGARSAARPTLTIAGPSLFSSIVPVPRNSNDQPLDLVYEPLILDHPGGVYTPGLATA